MRILVLADIDDWHWTHGCGEADVVVSCGDVADSLIREAAASHDCRDILAVKGNHDMPAPFPAGIRDLHLSTCEVGGIVFGGFNGCWRYKPRGHFLYDQHEVAKLLAGFPEVDVFVSHNSPRGIHDREDDVHTGFEALNSLIGRARPALLIHGHQHVNRESAAGATTIIGVFGHRMVEIPSLK